MSVLLGLAACAVSSFCFGTMYVAVRRYGDPGDGMVVQWLVCSSIFLVGLITYIVTGAPPFQPFAMLGGLLWTLGNLTAIPVIKTIGLGMGLLIWGAANCVVGWATGRFGLFGVKGSVPSSPDMNYAGLVFVIVGGVLFSLVRPKTEEQSPIESGEGGHTERVGQSESGQGTAEERAELVQREREEEQQSPGENEQNREEEGRGEETVVVIQTAEEGGGGGMGGEERQKSALRNRILAIALSVFAGVCYGSTFTPVIYMQDNPEKFHHPPKDAIFYVFSHYAGVYLTSSAVLLIYIGYMNNKPYVDNRLIFPSLLAGLFWAVAMLGWFVANDLLSQAITFPINAMAPGVIASLWSVLYFKEIEREDLKLLGAAMLVTIFGVTLVGLSKAI